MLNQDALTLEKVLPNLRWSLQYISDLSKKCDSFGNNAKLVCPRNPLLLPLLDPLLVLLAGDAAVVGARGGVTRGGSSNESTEVFVRNLTRA